MNNAIAAILLRSPVIPVVTLDSAEDAVPLADCLLAGGISVVEITLRTPEALRGIENIAKSRPAIAVGAGTCRTEADLRNCSSAGAAFAVSPGCTPNLLAAGNRCPIPWLPGAATVSEIMALAEAGFRTLKLFPAAALGGAGYLQTLSALMPDMRFCPTGGVTLQNAAEYLALPNVICVGGSWLVPNEAIRNKDWTTIESEVKKAAALRRVPGLTSNRNAI